ncbi:hypothetical protein BC940DRAFT_338484 [Gongronella butleri]|nr:hypothetical protein BC940DRAFT_338484 [Gongronella butleri]
MPEAETKPESVVDTTLASCSENRCDFAVENANTDVIAPPLPPPVDDLVPTIKDEVVDDPTSDPTALLNTAPLTEATFAIPAHLPLDLTSETDLFEWLGVTTTKNDADDDENDLQRVKKMKLRAENRLRKKRWRQTNEERNKDNDLRCRVNKRACKLFGDAPSEEKRLWIEEEFRVRRDRRKKRTTLSTAQKDNEQLIKTEEEPFSKKRRVSSLTPPPTKEEQQQQQQESKKRKAASILENLSLPMPAPPGLERQLVVLESAFLSVLANNCTSSDAELTAEWIAHGTQILQAFVDASASAADQSDATTTTTPQLADVLQRIATMTIKQPTIHTHTDNASLPDTSDSPADSVLATPLTGQSPSASCGSPPSLSLASHSSSSLTDFLASSPPLMDQAVFDLNDDDLASMLIHSLQQPVQLHPPPKEPCPYDMSVLMKINSEWRNQ